MKSLTPSNRFEAYLPLCLLLLISAAIYLPFIKRFGYFNDDWYLMYAAGAKGALAFKDIFIVDRPFRALVMIPAYTIFGANPLYYNLSAYFFRVLGSLGFSWMLRILWPRQPLRNLSIALIFLVYPGFLSLPNAIDFQSHIIGLAAGLFSIALTLKAVTTNHRWQRPAFMAVSIVLGLFYLSQMEWYIGLEALRWGSVLVISLREDGQILKALWKSFRRAYPTLLVSMGFLIWRLLIFKSERGATDVNLQFSDVLSSPLMTLSNWLSALANSILDSLFYAWITPFKRLSLSLAAYEWLPGLGIAAAVVFVWIVYQWRQLPDDAQSDKRSKWRREGTWIGLIIIFFGLLPVILVGREVDFKNFSRYTLIASIGVALLWQIGIELVPHKLIQQVLFGLLLVSASLTHYANGLVLAHETERMNRFWWEVSWRVPQMEIGTTLIVHYPSILAEEDYFIWGPANLIYYPTSMHPDYPQPGIYAAVMHPDTIEKILARERQEFSNRRSIRTYANYRNILILTEPSANSCVEVIDGMQQEYSSLEDPRFIKIGPYSETAHISLDESFRQPPPFPFGQEPTHTWCFFYEKAAFARQLGAWDEVLRLGKAATSQGLAPSDQIEWMPFLQAYARSGDLTELRMLGSKLTDPAVRIQACKGLSSIADLTAQTRLQIQNIFCNQ